MFDEWVDPSVIQALDKGKVDVDNGDYVTLYRFSRGPRVIEELLTFSDVRIERSYVNASYAKAQKGFQFTQQEIDEEGCP